MQPTPLVMAHKKRHRSDSFQAEQGGDADARKRLAAFHARMFELPQEDATAAAPETPRVLFKAKRKKHKHKAGDDAEDGEPVPIVKFNKIKAKKEKKVKKVVAAAVKEEKAVGPAAVKVPGLSSVVKVHVVTKQEKKVAAQVIKKVEKKKQKSEEKVVKKKAAQAPQWHSMHKGETQEDDDGVDPLEQALGKMKEFVTNVAKPPHKKHKTVTGEPVAVPTTKKPQKSVEVVEEKIGGAEAAADGDADNGSAENLSKCQKKRLKKKLRMLQRQNVKEQTNAAKNAAPAASGNVTTTMAEKKTANEPLGSNATAPSPKSARSRNKRKKSQTGKALDSASPKALTPQQRKGKLLTLSDEPESQITSKIVSAHTTAAKNMNGKPVKKIPTSKKALTPIAVSLANDTQKNEDMFLSARETVAQVPVASKCAGKVATPQVVHITDELSSESENDNDFDFDQSDGNSASIYSRLIDSAARERWELIEVGRLVRLFAAEWGFKASKTAQFLSETCPELVSVDFLEGLGVNLSAKQLVHIFEAGSGNSGVLMNKMASAVENGHLSVRDPSFVSALERRVALMESNVEVMELLHPLMESLSTVRDAGCLLKQLCEHWQLERKIALVQQVLLSNVFDDLDGNQDEILLDLPDLTGRLDFPSRLDQEDVDEHGNLKGFLANEDSEFSGDEGSEEELDEDDDGSENDEDPYEGESDSEEETEITHRPRGRNQFIEDEADVGEADEEEEEEEKHHAGDAASSSSDSD